jgi:hypothetical protein
MFNGYGDVTGRGPRPIPAFADVVSVEYYNEKLQQNANLYAGKVSEYYLMSFE